MKANNVCIIKKYYIRIFCYSEKLIVVNDIVDIMQYLTAFLILGFGHLFFFSRKWTHQISKSTMTDIAPEDMSMILVEVAAIAVYEARKEETVEAGAKGANRSRVDYVGHLRSQIASINPQNIERDSLQRRDS